MSIQRKMALGVLLLIAVPITYRALASLGKAIDTLFIMYRALAPVGRSREVLIDFTLLIPGAFWATIGVLAWVAFFAVKKQEEHRK